MGLRSYDDWKLATPPEYDLPDTCPKCGAQFEGPQMVCPDGECGWSAEADDEGPDPDRAYEEWRDREMESKR